MAINRDELREKILNGELDHEELKTIDKMEKFIDAELKRLFDGVANVRIRADLVEFRWDPQEDVRLNLFDGTRNRMKRELIRRYQSAGWKLKFEAGEDDGPNRSGTDFYIFGE